MSGRNKGPLAGVRVADLSTVLFGPYCTQLLGDLGAEVIKVESLDGDTFRSAGAAHHPGMAGAFVSTNRNKRSLAIDIKAREGREVLHRLLARSDVLVTNIRRKSLAQLGLDHASLEPAFPRLIHCSATGYGQGGPYEDDPAFDDTTQAMCGLASLQTAFCGEPRYVASAVADKISGLTLALAVVAAIRHRDVTGQAQSVDVSMYETMVAFTMLEHLSGAAFDPPAGPMIYPRTTSPHRRPYRTRDGYLSVMPYTDRHWASFFRTIARPGLAHDARFSSMAARTANIDELYGLLAQEMALHTSDWWLQTLKANDIPAVKVQTPQDLLHDRHLLDTGFIRRDPHPTEGTVVGFESPMRFGQSPARPTRLAPNLGEHSAEILAELGYNESDIDAFSHRGIIKQFSA
ncbi:CaiB/BaiF CoA transferase family protein [Alicycliphilus sp. T452]